jgi:large subunit ribosomal protein L18
MRTNYKTPRHKRKIRIRKTINGTQEIPRVAVFKSNKNIYVQAINDLDGHTIADASSLDKRFKEDSVTNNTAREVGILLGKELSGSGIKQIVFDRSGYIYHGQVKSLADGIRNEGIKF